MNYSKLLNGYNCLPISIKKDLLKMGNKKIKNILPKDIELLLNGLGLDPYNQKIVFITITKDGMFFNYDELKRVLSNYFSIPIDNNFENAVDGLRSRLNNKGFNTLPSNIRQECDDYSNRVMFSKYEEPSSHIPRPVREQILTDMAIEKSKAENSFKKFTEIKLDLFEKLVINEEDYKKVTIDFDQDKLNLYLAFIVKEYAEKFKNKNKIKDYRFALKYINDYLDNNKELLDNNYEVSKYFPVDETFNINSLKEYMDSISIDDLEDKSISKDKSTKKTYSKK